MTPRHSLQVGTALSVTVVTGYALCTIVFALWPESAASFMNALFHGLDFRKLQAESAPFEFSGFAKAAAVLAVWAFLLGALFAATLDALVHGTRASPHGEPLGQGEPKASR